jgi:hypothetical protein
MSRGFCIEPSCRFHLRREETTGASARIRSKTVVRIPAQSQGSVFLIVKI